FLNPDAELIKEKSLSSLVDVLEQNPEYGLIGPNILLEDGKYQKTVRNLPTAYAAFKEYVLQIKNSYDFYLPDTNKLMEVESVVGACMVLKREVFEKVGKFNEKYFLYYEDIELCKKVRENKLKIGFYPLITIKHILGVSSRSNKKVSEFLYKSAKKYHGLFEYYLIQFILRFSNAFLKR